MAILGDQIKKFEQDSVVTPQQFILWMEGEEKKHNKHQNDLDTNWIWEQTNDSNNNNMIMPTSYDLWCCRSYCSSLLKTNQEKIPTIRR
jgi:hypothetical protein